MGTFYVTGVIIATGLGIMLLIVTEIENKKKVVKDELQPGMQLFQDLCHGFCCNDSLEIYAPIEEVLRERLIIVFFIVNQINFL